MLQIIPLLSGPLSVLAYNCSAAPGSAVYAESHGVYSLSCVLAGSFGYHTQGRCYDLVPGALLIGRPGDEFTCTHEHHLGGDRCLSVQMSGAWVEAHVPALAAGVSRALPPLASLMLAAELAQASVTGHSAVSVEEAAVMLIQRFQDIAGAARSTPPQAVAEHDRRRMTELALLIEEQVAEPLSLGTLAAMIGASPFHLLRTFTRVIGTTPHQYLLRARLRRAARLLCATEQSVTTIALDVGFNDLSNFSRTFHRAAGLPPAQFRRRARRAARAPVHATV